MTFKVFKLSTDLRAVGPESSRRATQQAALRQEPISILAAIPGLRVPHSAKRVRMYGTLFISCLRAFVSSCALNDLGLARRHEATKEQGEVMG